MAAAKWNKEKLATFEFQLKLFQHWLEDDSLLLGLSFKYVSALAD